MRRCSALLCTLVFAALGVFVGYLVPGENAMQVLGPGLAHLAFLGNVFIPIDDQHQPDLAHRGVDADVRRRRDHPGAADRRAAWYAVVNAVGWLAIFVAGAAWRMSKDTARV